jgi:DNA-binding NtrC family response regulator
VEDIPVLAKYFVDKYSREYRKNVTKISPETEALLVNYNWPGNIRELRNTIERAVILGSGDTIVPDQLPKEITVGLHKKDETPWALQIPQGGLCLKTLERELVRQALERAAGNQIRAAHLLGISRDAFRGRLKKYGML